MVSIDGSELLVINGDENDLRGLAKLFSSAGLMVSRCTTTDKAQATLREKYFPVVVVDANAAPVSALEFVSWVRDTSSTTEVIVTVRTAGFDECAAFFRAGALDVVQKRRSTVKYLQERVREAAVGQQLANESIVLLKEARAMLEEFLNVLMDLARQTIDPVDVEASFDYAVCVVDPEDFLADDLGAASDEFRVTHCLTNGEALDKVATARYDLLVVPVESDLPGRMVARTALSTNPAMDIWLYSGRPGAGQVTPLEPVGTEGRTQIFPDPARFARGIVKRKRHALAMAKERRVMEQVKSQNLTIIRRYGELRDKIERAIRAAAND